MGPDKKCETMSERLYGLAVEIYSELVVEGVGT